MHILFLTDNFPPEVNAPATRTFEHCREWVRAGHEVTVVTCVPNFPTGKVFKGYRNRPWQSEDMDGVRVIRVWSYIAANQGFARRVADYVSYMAAAILAAPFVRGVDVVVGTSPHLFTACAACTVGGMKRIPYVFELRDLWPASIQAVGAMKHSRALAMLERLELYLYRRASVIVSVTTSFREDLSSRGIDASKIRVITNGVDATRFAPCERDRELSARYGLKDKFVAGYIGTHGMAHALEAVLRAAESVQAADTEDRFRFLFIGDGASKEGLLAQARSRGIANVVFLDTVPKSEVVRHWSLLDVSIIHLKKSHLFRSVIPSKLFECMAMGIPVLHGVQGESARIVEQEGVGLLFEPEDSEALGRHVLRMAGDPHLLECFRNNGLRAAAKFDRTRLANAMLEALPKPAVRTSNTSGQ